MKKIVYSVLIVVSLVFFLDCASKKPQTFSDANIYFVKAEKDFEKGKWLKAIDNYRLYILNNPGGEMADDSQFKIGECYYNREEYLLAIAEYNQLVERYKYSDLAVDGYFKIAMSYYELSPKYQREQTNTDKALRQLQEFIDAFPGTNNAKIAQEKIGELRTKLGRKLYESGVIYRKLSQWDSAILYFDDMLNQYYDTKYAVYAKYEKAYCFIKKHDFAAYEKAKSEFESDNTIAIEEKTELLQKLELAHNKELRKIERAKRKEKEQERRKRLWF
ncbi:MAG: outer membrane protein assembly factor BamD [Candidatus Marinimicrobia bacterium]|nr:outer membrane protein assembly factor BamD [Candidatus Neomarinimicrobiota bacterium]